MSRIVALAVAIAIPASVSAQSSMYTVSPISPANSVGVAPMVIPYMPAGGLSVAYGGSPVAYRAAFMTSFGSGYVPNYSFPYYAPGYGYAPLAFGIGYTASGDRAYITAQEATTTVPASFVPAPLANAFVTDSPPVSAPMRASTASTIARITAYVPADAEVLVNGKAMTETGPVRTFETPSISGVETYTVVVRQKADGKAKDQTMTVSVKPGDHSSVRVLQ